MILLALETATEACSVAVWVDGQVRERFEVAPRGHAERVLPWAEQLLAEAGLARAQLDAIAVGRGPGAFTGVRLAIAVAQGIALALDRPVLPVSTLRTLAARSFSLAPAAEQGPDGERSGSRAILAAIDARMGEIYAAAFRPYGGDMAALGAEVVVPPADYAFEDAGAGTHWTGLGTGFAAAEAALARRLSPRFDAIDASALPHAADLARLAALDFARDLAVPPERVEPAYLRDNVALTLEQQAAHAARR
ncbi:MAG: tRNA (adenosine(37)-N6)-threonylcarbamoyltransferase complex dimerization subunit type 1 TsaB [Pseudoxanthomonas sp.]